MSDIAKITQTLELHGYLRIMCDDENWLIYATDPETLSTITFHFQQSLLDVLSKIFWHKLQFGKMLPDQVS